MKRSHHFTVNITLVWVYSLWETVLSSFKNLKIELPYDPVISVLNIYPKNTKKIFKNIKKNLKDICMPMLIVVLLTITKLRKQPKCAMIYN